MSSVQVQQPLATFFAYDTAVAANMDDERLAEYWQNLLVPSGWAVHMSDEAVPGHELPYALAVIEVEHNQGSGYFTGPVNDTGALEANSVMVFANEITPASRPSAPATNRQSDGNTYLYTLQPTEHYFSDNETDFDGLPTGRYRLEIMIPLFHVERVVGRFNHRTGCGYNVCTGNGHIYDAQELEQKDGGAGIWSTSTNPAQEMVWKIPRKAENIQAFGIQMHARMTTFRKAGGDCQLQGMSALDELECENGGDGVAEEGNRLSDSSETLRDSPAYC